MHADRCVFRRGLILCNSQFILTGSEVLRDAYVVDQLMVSKARIHEHAFRAVVARGQRLKHRVEQPESLQGPHSIGTCRDRPSTCQPKGAAAGGKHTEPNASADFSKGGLRVTVRGETPSRKIAWKTHRGFEQVDRDAGLLKCDSTCEAAHATANHGDFEVLLSGLRHESG